MHKIHKMYREGLPRVKEPIFAHSRGGRDSGFYGTGIYAYRDLAVTDQKTKDVYELHTPDINLAVACVTDLKKISNELMGRYNGRIDPSNDITDSAIYDTFITVGNRNNTVFTTSGIEKSVQRAKKCVKQYGDEVCSLPINHLFIDQGFHGIYPIDCREKMVKTENGWERKYVEDENLAANSNMYGIVIFQEAKERIREVIPIPRD